MSSSPRKKLKLTIALQGINGTQDWPDSLPDMNTRKDNHERRIQESTQLLDLNDDCLRVIFEKVSLMDLCSITQTCTRFNAIGHRLFKAKHKICDFSKISAKTPAEATKFFLIFGSLIKELDICPYSNSNPIDVMDAVIRYCTTLESLQIEEYEIPDNQEKIAEMGKLFQNLRKLRINDLFIEDCHYHWTYDTLFTPNGNLIGSFSNCRSLVDLEVFNCEFLNQAIFESSFPKLECFKYCGSVVNCHMDRFIFRHPNLKSFCMVNEQSIEDDQLPALKMAADNCKNLEKVGFEFGILARSAEYELLLKNLSKLPKLREIEVFWIKDFATMFAKELPNFRHTLEALSLSNVDDGSALIPAIVRLNKLRLLQLRSFSSVSEGIDPLGRLTRLTSLSISQDHHQANLKFDLVELVERLLNLTKLQLHVNDYKIGNQTYLHLVHTVERRPNLWNRTLRIDCPTAVDFTDLKLAAVQFVKFQEFE